MQRWSIVTPLLVAACAQPVTASPDHVARVTAPPPADATASAVAPIDLATARGYFADFDALCQADGGKLWGVSFCGPMVFADPATHAAVTNRAGAPGLSRTSGAVFFGHLPDDVGIANTAVQWGGQGWTMIMWEALGGDRAERLELMGHEAFHRLQPTLGLIASGDTNAHLDTADGRFLLELEWNALQEALRQTAALRAEAIADALTFRAARRARFPEAAAREVPLEIMEGLAEYSGARLAGYSVDQVLALAADKRAQGFVRGFAYVSGPLYGYLLDAAAADWRKQVTKATDLGALLAACAHVSARPTSDVNRIADKYGGKALRVAEDDRERQRTERNEAWRRSLVQGPVLIVDLGTVESVTFDPGRVFPLSDAQVVYTSRKLIAQWGTLTVDDGAILEDQASHEGHVSLAGANPDGSSGKGWSLTLHDGWIVAPGTRQGDLVVRRR